MGQINNINPKKAFLILFTMLIFILVLKTGITGLFNLTQSIPPTPDYNTIRQITRSVSLIQRHYYDPQRINPLKMLQSGLTGLSQQIPELIVTFSEKNDKIEIKVGNTIQMIPLEKTARLYDILKPTAQIFTFVAKAYQGEIKPDKREYAFISGMLEKLDPHSNLLPPEIFKEFKTQTEGEYGGIGIVVGIKDDDLTVIAPIEDTPSIKLGIRAEDKILEIDHIPTINMPLSEAVEKLRGKVGSSVTLTLKRKDKDSWEVTIIREKIIIQSVKSKLVVKDKKRIAILRVRSFQEDTFTDMVKAIETMGSFDGVILDLRDNPGGLLDQSLEMADLFIKQGDLLYTVGADISKQEVTKATPDNEFGNQPVIVLVNQGSASASEIVAGALKNNDRALVIGAQTFGKGSVQSLFSLANEAAIKITIAQYLTPGHISIQAVGITPDIRIVPTRIMKDQPFDLWDDENYGEKNLDEHLENSKFLVQEKPAFQYRYLDTTNPDKDQKESEYTATINESKDYVLSVALNLITGSHLGTKNDLLQKAIPWLTSENKNQDKEITKALHEQQIDWSEPPSETAKPIQLKFVTTAEIIDKAKSTPLGKLMGGTEAIWKLKVTNQSEADLYRVIGVVKSENPIINQKEFIFGYLPHGDTRGASVNIKVPDDFSDFDEPTQIEIHAANTSSTYKITKPMMFVEKPKPHLGYSYTLTDDGSLGSKGNGNGLPEKGETLVLNLSIFNQGQIDAQDVLANLKNSEGTEIIIKEGRATIGKLESGQEKKTHLSFAIPSHVSKDEIKIDLGIMDKKSKAGLGDSITLPLGGIKTIKIDPPFGNKQLPPVVQLKERILSSDQKILKLTGQAIDENALEDVMIFIGGKKVYYQASPNGQKNKILDFTADIPLDSGANFISIQARDERKLTGHKFLSVMGPKDQEVK